MFLLYESHFIVLFADIGSKVKYKVLFIITTSKGAESVVSTLVGECLIYCLSLDTKLLQQLIID